MKPLNERLLDAWLRLSTIISNERFVSEMTYNESLVCYLLRRNQLQHPGQYLTATDLCRLMQMQKSQMNRTLNTMEQKHYIRRERSRQDKRQVYIISNLEQTDAFQRQHQKTLELVDALTEKVGQKRAEEILSMLLEIANAAEDTLHMQNVPGTQPCRTGNTNFI